jgi:hypothetical protein
MGFQGGNWLTFPRIEVYLSDACAIGEHKCNA